MLLFHSHLSWLTAAGLLNFVILSVAHAQSRKLPPGFLLGASSAAYQIEGAWNVNGKGENTWDHLMLTNPNHTFDHKWGDVACDSYHNTERDVDMIRELGLDVYRFSLSWSRLLPTGFIDVVNPDGVRYYNQLIDNLLNHSITPMITLFHWDLPQPLQDRGGWPNPELADYFVDYANLAFGLFGDRVKLWITFNEPHQYCKQSYGVGNNPPAINETGVADYKCGHTVLRAHAKAYHLYKKEFAAQGGKISITLDSDWYEPKNKSSPSDVEAAERSMEFELGWFAHPIYTFYGGYPPVMVQRIAEECQGAGLSTSRLPSFTEEERSALIGSSDFFALNHFTTYLVENRTNDPNWPNPSMERDKGVYESSDPTWSRSDALYEFSIVPWGFRKLLNWIRTQYNNPSIYITECGYPDGGGLEDYDRILYFSSYLEEMLHAIHTDKSYIIGFTAWSLMDNFEWRYGYTLKYGLFHIDFTDPDRPHTPKLSSEFFKNLADTRELPWSTAEFSVAKDTDVTAVVGKTTSAELKSSVISSTTLPSANSVDTSSLRMKAHPNHPAWIDPSPYFTQSPRSLPPISYGPRLDQRPVSSTSIATPSPNWFGGGLPVSAQQAVPRPDMPKPGLTHPYYYQK